MNISDLVFIGIKGSVVALNRTTGQQQWATHLKGSDFVNVVVQNDLVFASCYGEIFCLDPLTGNGLWHNRLTGFGTGLATITGSGCTNREDILGLAEKRRRDEEASAAAAANQTSH